MSNRPRGHRPRQLIDGEQTGPAAVSPLAPTSQSGPRTPRGARVKIDSEELKNGLAQLVLTLIKLLHELLEKQAIRRIDSGHLEGADCERVGLALMKQSEQIERLRVAFGLAEEDLNIDLGPLGKLV